MVAVAACSLLAGTACYGRGDADAGAAQIAPPERRLPERERVVFNVKWLGLDVGRITASINGVKKINGRDAYELEAVAMTGGICSSIYPVNDRYVSYMDTERLHTLRHEVYRREGRYRKDAVTDFDQDAHRAYFTNLIDGSKKTIDIPPSVQDALGTAYYFRLIPVELGKPVEIRVYNNEQVYRLFGVADGIRTIRVPRLGARAGFHIQPYAELDGRIVKKGRASGYFSCDPGRLPLLVSIRGPVFTEVVGYPAAEDLGR